MRSSRAAPKFASTSTPTTASPATRLAVPIPPLRSKQTIPVPAPSAPSPTTPPAAASARPASAASTCTTRASLSQLSSHSPTTGMTTSSTPTTGSAATAADTAPSYTRPTAIVAVRNTGVSITPHSRTCRLPVSSPAPFRTAVPAGSGAPVDAPVATAVTPDRPTPRPAGGSGSSRHTVTWPTATPGTSAIESEGPASRSPIRSPRSRRRLTPAIARAGAGRTCGTRRRSTRRPGSCGAAHVAAHRRRRLLPGGRRRPPGLAARARRGAP